MTLLTSTQSKSPKSCTTEAFSNIQHDAASDRLRPTQGSHTSAICGKSALDEDRGDPSHSTWLQSEGQDHLSPLRGAGSPSTSCSCEHQRDNCAFHVVNIRRGLCRCPSPRNGMSRMHWPLIPGPASCRGVRSVKALHLYSFQVGKVCQWNRE